MSRTNRQPAGHLIVAVLVGLLAVSLWLPSAADQPSVAYIFPAGGQRGTTVHFRVGAHFLHGGSPFYMRGDGIESSDRITETNTVWFEGPMIFKPASQQAENYPRDHSGKVKIAADAELGVRYWQLSTSQGAVPSGPFVIGDLPEIVEQEVDGRPIPTAVNLPVTINGRIFPREDVDIWCFQAKEGQSVTCEVTAARIGSPLDSRIEVRGPDGRRVAENTDHFGTDSWLRFRAPASGTYQVRIHDITFAGLQKYVYRLTITSDLYVDFVFPLGGQRGTEVAFWLRGQECPEASIEQRLPLVATESCLQQFSIVAARSNPVQISLSDFPEHVESGESENAAPTEVVPPTVLNGRIESAGDIDRWPLKLDGGSTYAFDLKAATYGSALDAVVVVFDAAEKPLVESGSTPENPIEPSGKFVAPESGVCFVEIRDMEATRGGPEFAYRLTITPEAVADFQLKLPTDALTLYRDKEAKLKILVARIGGHQEPISLRAEGLPDGVGAEAITIPGDKSEAQLTFKAESTARIQALPVRIVGTGKTADGEQQRTATMSRQAGAPIRDSVLLAVSMPTPFTIAGDEYRIQYAARGTIHRRRYRLQRGSYEGPVEIALADRQIRHRQGVTGHVLKIAPGATEFDYPVRLPTWLEMNRTGRIVVMAVGEVEDEEGRKHKVSYTSGQPKDQIIFLTAPCPMGVEVSPGSVAVRPNSEATLDVTLRRGVLRKRPVRVEILLPDHVQAVAAESITIPAQETIGQLRLQFGSAPGPFNLPLTIRASMRNDNQDMVFAEQSFDLVPLEPNVAQLD